MDDLHNDQIKRLEEVAAEIDAALVEIDEHVEGFKQKFTGVLQSTFDELGSAVDDRMARLAPRLASLEKRGAALRAAIEDERAARLRETTTVLAPLRDQITRLGGSLEEEREIRENREP